MLESIKNKKERKNNMKKLFKLAALGLLSAMTFTSLSNVKADEVSANDDVKNLLADYFNNGSYKKGTEIYLSEDS